MQFCVYSIFLRNLQVPVSFVRNVKREIPKYGYNLESNWCQLPSSIFHYDVFILVNDLVLQVIDT